jgi:CRP-like cAMP-binding protein
LIKIIPGFKKFIGYYNIDDLAVENVLKYYINHKAACYITYKKFEKGSYIFKQGDKSDFFYCIISGAVSIRERKKIFYLHNDVRKMRLEEKEEEKIILEAGQCFGEWGLIYKKPRSSSFYCIQDCDLFVLDSHGFELSFNVC